MHKTDVLNIGDNTDFHRYGSHMGRDGIQETIWKQWNGCWLGNKQYLHIFAMVTTMLWRWPFVLYQLLIEAWRWSRRLCRVRRQFGFRYSILGIFSLPLLDSSVLGRVFLSFFFFSLEFCVTWFWGWAGTWWSGV